MREPLRDGEQDREQQSQRDKIAIERASQRGRGRTEIWKIRERVSERARERTIMDG
jgi:hypothetical protein